MAQDIRINLLPWREALRQRKQREFGALLILMPVLAAVMLGGFDWYYASSIQGQTLRNNFLASEVEGLEARIEEVERLRQQRDDLLARMEVIQNLQDHRPVIVRVFDELARQLAPQVFFTGLTMSREVQGGVEGDVITITGIATSNNRISRLLRNFSESQWFVRPNIIAINADPDFGPQASRFSLSVMCR